jgi:hypothetical protein
MELGDPSDLFSDAEPNDALPTAFDSDNFRPLVVFATGVNRSQHGEGR